MKLSDAEKLVLIMLSEVYEHLKIKGEVDPKFVKEAIFSGNVWGLKWQYPGIFDMEENAETVRKDVLDILDMWSLIEWAYKDLPAQEKARIESEAAPIGKDVKFRGFDGNNEGEYISVARFLIDHLDRFTTFKGRDLNSHMPSVEGYQRMCAVFDPMRSSLTMGSNLSATQIIQILKQLLHPSRR